MINLIILLLFAVLLVLLFLLLFNGQHPQVEIDVTMAMAKEDLSLRENQAAI